MISYNSLKLDPASLRLEMEAVSRDLVARQVEETTINNRVEKISALFQKYLPQIMKYLPQILKYLPQTLKYVLLFQKYLQDARRPPSLASLLRAPPLRMQVRQPFYQSMPGSR